MTRHLLAAAIVLLVAVPATPSTIRSLPPSEEGFGAIGPEIALFRDDAIGPREAAAFFLRLLADGGLDRVAEHVAVDGATFLDGLAGAGGRVLVIAAEGNPAGLLVGNDLVAWPTIRATLAVSGAQGVAFLACDSAFVGEIPGVPILADFQGEVDRDVAVLAAAYAIGSAFLTGPALERFAAAHTSHVEALGGAAFLAERLVQPVAPLSQTAISGNYCSYAFAEWRSPGRYRYTGDDPNCRTMHASTENPACTPEWRQKAAMLGYLDRLDYVCPRTSAQDENRAHETVRQSSSVEMHMGTEQGFFGNLLSIGFDYNANDGKKYKVYVSLGGHLDDSKGDVKYRGSAVRWSGSCYKIGSIGDVYFPYLPVVQEGLNKIPGVTVNARVFDIWGCASLEAGLLVGERKGSIEGRLSLEGDTGLTGFVCWWACFGVDVGLEIKVQLGIEGEITLNQEEGALYFHITAQPSVEIRVKANFLNIYWSLQVPIGDKWDIADLRFCYACHGPAASSQSMSSPSLPLALATREEGPLSAITSDGLTEQRVASLLELHADDAALRGLSRSGDLACIGAPVPPPGSSLFLDLGDPNVQACLGTAGIHTALGIPGGHATTAAACPAQTLEVLVVVRLDDCDPDRTIVGLGFATHDGTGASILGLESPAAAAQAKGLAVSVAGIGDQGARTVCLGNPVRLFTDASYSLQEICQWFTYASTAGDPVDAAGKALTTHLDRIVLCQGCLVSWLTDACTLLQASESTASLDPAVRGGRICAHVEPVADSVTGAVPTMVAWDQLLLDLKAGIDEVNQFAGSYGVPFLTDWSARNPEAAVAGAESVGACSTALRTAGGGPCSAAGAIEAVHAIDRQVTGLRCTAGQTLGITPGAGPFLRDFLCGA